MSRVAASPLVARSPRPACVLCLCLPPGAAAGCALPLLLHKAGATRCEHCGGAGEGGSSGVAARLNRLVLPKLDSTRPPGLLPGVPRHPSSGLLGGATPSSTAIHGRAILLWVFEIELEITCSAECWLVASTAGVAGDVCR